jgi:predicted site-specific integrase-resolvase
MDTNATAQTLVTLHGAPEWVRLAIAARLAGVSKRTVSRWARRGLVRVSRPAGGAVLVNTHSLRSLIEAGEQLPAA